jgi:hypothetical protein
LYDEMERERRHEDELAPEWECGACGVQVQPWDMPHEHYCYATGYTSMIQTRAPAPGDSSKEER